MTAVWNSEFEAGMDTLPAHAWDRWLWDCNLHDPIQPLNECHLLGFLIARYRVRYNTAPVVRLELIWPALVHGSSRVCDLTVKQLLETVADIQHHWSDYVGGDMQTALDAALHQFGVFLTGIPPAFADHLPSLTTEDPPRLTIPAMRRLCTLFCVLYRHLHLASVALPTPCVGPNNDIQPYHLQAGMDSYYEHMMLSDLPPAARVAYQQDFAGMYHCVSQVIYSHYPDYKRRKPPSIEVVRGGVPAVEALASVLQLMPGLTMVYEDDLCPTDAWVLLLVSGGTLYLMEPGPSATRSIWTCPQLWGIMSLLGGSAPGP